MTCCRSRPVVATATAHKEKPPPFPVRVDQDKAPGGDLLLHGRTTLPSAHARFTSEFGMGSGGTTPLWPPGKGWEQRNAPVPQLLEKADLGCNRSAFSVSGNSRWIHRKRVTSVEVNSNSNLGISQGHVEASWGYMVKPHGSLVSVSSMHCCTSTPDLSTT